MKIEINTKEDSHEDIKKVIKMLQHIIGESQEIFTNQPVQQEISQSAGSAFNNLFGDDSSSQNSTIETSTDASQETKEEETSESTEDLFAELFSEEELKKMEPVKEDEEEIKHSKKKYNVELY